MTDAELRFIDRMNGECRKIQYTTKKAAKVERKALIRKFGDGDRGLQPYWCRTCHCYHLGHPRKALS